MEKTMYEKVDWPDIQEFMEDYDYTDRVYFDPDKMRGLFLKIWLKNMK